MRIAQTADGRYVKILSPQMQGMIGRLYKEVNDRKSSDDQQNANIQNQSNKIGILTSQVDAMTIRYTEMTDILRRMFPENEPIAVIEKPLEVNGSVKATTFVSTETEDAPFSVASTALNQNLNAEFLNGNSLTDVHQTMDNKVQDLNDDVTDRFTLAKQQADADYAPIDHVNAAGPGVHPVATQTVEGFMSASDKLKLDRMELPGGMIISNTAPVAPRLQQIWIDTN